VSVKGDDDGLGNRLKELARSHPRYGFRRLCRKLGLLLRQRRRRKRRGIGVGLPCRAERPGQVWAYDFVEDRTERGMKLRILTVIDEFTRECVALEKESLSAPTSWSRSSSANARLRCPRHGMSCSRSRSAAMAASCQCKPKAQSHWLMYRDWCWSGAGPIWWKSVKPAAPQRDPTAVPWA
jgi:hypothetical protein